MDVLLDTSFMVTAFADRIDVSAELLKFGRPKLFVLDLVVGELEKLAGGNGKDAAAARMSLDYIKRRHAAVIRTKPGNTDKRIIEYSLNRNMTVCTVDAELRDSLRRGGMEVITIRQGKYLVRAD